MVTEETLHRTLLAIPDPDEAVIQLVELANRAGGPDNITCIVADVLDTASAKEAPSEISVVAGAVSNQGGAPMARADTPANRARRLTQPDRPADAPTRISPRPTAAPAVASRRTRGHGPSSPPSSWSWSS